jgi:hypothetical protein
MKIEEFEVKRLFAVDWHHMYSSQCIQDQRALSSLLDEIAKKKTISPSKI